MESKYFHLEVGIEFIANLEIPVFKPKIANSLLASVPGICLVDEFLF